MEDGRPGKVRQISVGVLGTSDDRGGLPGTVGDGGGLPRTVRDSRGRRGMVGDYG